MDSEFSQTDSHKGYSKAFSYTQRYFYKGIQSGSSSPDHPDTKMPMFLCQHKVIFTNKIKGFQRNSLKEITIPPLKSED